MTYETLLTRRAAEFVLKSALAEKPEDRADYSEYARLLLDRRANPLPSP